jgi:hypothetical protein
MMQFTGSTDKIKGWRGRKEEGRMGDESVEV